MNDTFLRKFKVLPQVSTMITSGAPIQEVLTGVAKDIADAMETKTCTIYLKADEKLYGQDPDHIYLWAEVGYEKGLKEPVKAHGGIRKLQEMSIPDQNAFVKRMREQEGRGPGITMYMIIRNESIRLNSPDEVKGHDWWHGYFDDQLNRLGRPCENLLGVPLQYERHVIGCLKLENRRRVKNNTAEAFSKEDLYILEVIGGVLAVALQNAQSLELLNRDTRLVKIYNRDFLMRELQNRAGANKGFALIFFDIDGFKRYNDDFGYEIGDQIIADVAENVRKETQPNNGRVVRYGGDEFAVIIETEEPSVVRTLWRSVVEALGRLRRYKEDPDGEVVINGIPISTGSIIRKNGEPMDPRSFLNKAIIGSRVAKHLKGTKHVSYRTIAGILDKQKQHSIRVAKSLNEQEILLTSGYKDGVFEGLNFEVFYREDVTDAVGALLETRFRQVKCDAIITRVWENVSLARVVYRQTRPEITAGDLAELKT